MKVETASLCTKCGAAFSPTNYQLRKREIICPECRRERARSWRRLRKANGRPVVSTQMPREWHQRYQREYFSADANRIRRNANARRRTRNPETRHKIDARLAVRNAVRRGEIEKPTTCEQCGSCEPLQGHHEDYNNPLDVKWLCRRCHNAADAKAKGGAA